MPLLLVSHCPSVIWKKADRRNCRNLRRRIWYEVLLQVFQSSWQCVWRRRPSLLSRWSHFHIKKLRYHGLIFFFFIDGNTVISPVGNKISMFDLKNHRWLPTRCINSNETVTFVQIRNAACGVQIHLHNSRHISKWSFTSGCQWGRGDPSHLSHQV